MMSAESGPPISFRIRHYLLGILNISEAPITWRPWLEKDITSRGYGIRQSLILAGGLALYWMICATMFVQADIRQVLPYVVIALPLFGPAFILLRPKSLRQGSLVKYRFVEGNVENILSLSRTRTTVLAGCLAMTMTLAIGITLVTVM